MLRIAVSGCVGVCIVSAKVSVQLAPLPRSSPAQRRHLRTVEPDADRLPVVQRQQADIGDERAALAADRLDIDRLGRIEHQPHGVGAAEQGRRRRRAQRKISGAGRRCRAWRRPRPRRRLPCRWPWPAAADRTPLSSPSAPGPRPWVFRSWVFRSSALPASDASGLVASGLGDSNFGCSDLAASGLGASAVPAGICFGGVSDDSTGSAAAGLAAGSAAISRAGGMSAVSGLISIFASRATLSDVGGMIC